MEVFLMTAVLFMINSQDIFAENIPRPPVTEGHIDALLTILSQETKYYKAAGVLEMTLTYQSPLQLQYQFCLEMGDRTGSSHGPHMVPLQVGNSVRTFSEYEPFNNTGRLTLKLDSGFVESHGTKVIGLLITINELSSFQTTQYYVSGVSINSILSVLKRDGEKAIFFPGLLHVMQLPPATIRPNERLKLQLTVKADIVSIPGTSSNPVNYVALVNNMLIASPLGTDGDIPSETLATSDGIMTIVVDANDVEKGVLFEARDSAGHVALRTSVIRSASFVSTETDLTLASGREFFYISPKMYLPLEMTHQSQPPPASTSRDIDVSSTLPSSVVCVLSLPSVALVLRTIPRFELYLSGNQIQLSKPVVYRSISSKGMLIAAVFYIEKPAMYLVDGGGYSCRVRYGPRHALKFTQAPSTSIRLVEPPHVEASLQILNTSRDNVQVLATCQGQGSLPLTHSFLLQPASGLLQPLIEVADPRVQESSLQQLNNGLSATVVLLAPASQLRGAQIHCRIADRLSSAVSVLKM